MPQLLSTISCQVMFLRSRSRTCMSDRQEQHYLAGASVEKRQETPSTQRARIYAPAVASAAASNCAITIRCIPSMDCMAAWERA